MNNNESAPDVTVDALGGTAIWRLRPGVLPPENLPLVRHRRGEGFAVRTDMLGVTSIACAALNLDARCYNTLIDCFHSSAARETRPAHSRCGLPAWCCGYSPSRCALNGSRCVWSATASRSPSAAERCRRSSSCISSPEANTKPEFITGHSLQAVSLLVQAASSFFAVPLAVRIHEKLVWSNRDRRTPARQNARTPRHRRRLEQPFYFVADAYYATHKIVAGLLQQNNHLLTRMKSNAVAYTAPPAAAGRTSRGRPPGLWQQDQAQLPCGKPPATSNQPQAPSTARTR